VSRPVVSWRTCALVCVPLFAAFAVPTLAQQAPQAPPAAPAGPTAGEKYVNIQVLKDIPATQLHDTMLYIEAATATTCQFCHVKNDAGEWAFDKDDRTNKKTAREMIVMTRAINAQSFKGQPEVTCQTCHQGRRSPGSTPQLAQMATPEQLAARAAAGPGGPGAPGGAPGQPPAAGTAGQPPAAGAPGQPPSGGAPGQQRARVPSETVDDVIAKLVQSAGGADALKKLTGLVAKGTATNRMGQTSPASFEETAKGQYRLSIDGQIPTARAYDGTAAWSLNADKVRNLEGIEAAAVALAADMVLPLQVKDRYQGLTVRAYSRIDGKDVIAMQGRPSPIASETLFVDRTTGQLLRRSISLITPLGRLPMQIDYSDFRAVGGVTLPYAIKMTDWESITDLKISDVTLNPKIDPSRFAKPVPKTVQ